MLHFSYGAASHVGLVREHNEDAGFAGPYLQLVADGVGGAAAGEVASATTAYVVTALAMGRPDQEAATLLAEAVVTAHRELQRGTRDDEARHGMATTLTAVLARDDRVTLAHVGDSRAYLVARRRARPAVDRPDAGAAAGRRRETSGRTRSSAHPFRNVVLRSVNGDEPVEPALRELDLVVGDRLLLCSDGLTDLVPEDEILQALIVADPDEAARALVGPGAGRGWSRQRHLSRGRSPRRPGGEDRRAPAGCDAGPADSSSTRPPSASSGP